MHTLKDILIEAAKRAGKVHRRIREEGPVQSENKYVGTDPSDVVTRADRESEQVLRRYLKRVLPGFNIMGEEFGGEYNGNGKVIFLDPLDGTKGFVEGSKNFGPIIGVYENGRCIGGVTYNVLKEEMYVATEADGFTAVNLDTSTPPGTFLIAAHLHQYPTFLDELEQAIRSEFPGHDVRKNKSGVTCRGRVHAGYWTAEFHAALARHDIAADPLFGRLTGTKVTDHRGMPYEPMEPLAELKKYQSNDKKQMYSNPILVARPQVHEKMLAILGRFSDVLDEIKNPG